jgi:hypothetical protein
LFASSSSVAAPSAVGKYSGVSTNGFTTVYFEASSAGIIRNLQIVALPALCTTTLPGEPASPAEERVTNITRKETPRIRLRSNSRFSAAFELTSLSRVDFKNAQVEITGRLRGKRGSVSVVIQMNKTYEDGSTQTCGGSVSLEVKKAPR